MAYEEDQYRQPLLDVERPQTPFALYQSPSVASESPRTGRDSDWEHHDPYPAESPSKPVDKQAAYNTGLAAAIKGYGAAHRETRARRSEWLSLDPDGQAQHFQADKRTVIQKFKLRIPIRDMRLVDPSLLTSETGKMLVRDNGIVFSMEHVRLIITATEAIITKDLSTEASAHTLFVEQLMAGIKAAAAQQPIADSNDTGPQKHGVKPLPFELTVLEVALGDVCQSLARLTAELDAVAHPALEALTKHVSTGILERVRKVKTRHQRLMTRVTTVREELERFLEDDDDMAKMCLSRRHELEQLQVAQTAPVMQHGPSFSYSHTYMRRLSMNLSRSSMSAQRTASPVVNPLASDSQGADQAADDFNNALANEDADAEALQAVENLLESYFVQIDSTYDRLVSMGEYIKDTEEYVNIELDSSRNRLIRLEIVLTAGTFALAIFSLVGGVLGENLVLPAAITKNLSGFILVNIITMCFCILVFYAIMAYIRYQQLM